MLVKFKFGDIKMNEIQNNTTSDSSYNPSFQPTIDETLPPELFE